ncbi:MAG: GtrA family protein [Chlorobiaceae bacterium]|nr:GtrA family protein [Chlorobiaceae bacterium]
MKREQLVEAAAGLFWFGMAGAIGFLVDVGVLYLLKGAMGLYAARVVSFLCAAFSTWLFNRAVTFRGRRSGHSRAKEFGLYLALMTIGGSVNYGVFALLVSRMAMAAQHPVVGVAAGSLAGMAVNLLTSRFLLFRHRHD